MNPFDLTNQQNNTVHQYDYDWRHTVNFTGEFGKIYPVFSEHVPAKTSLRIQPFAGIQMMPLAFPVQTDIIARWSAYRIPLRTLWKDYKDYIGNFKKGLVEPYIDFKNSFEKSLGIGQLFDHLDVPVTISGRYAGKNISYDSQFGSYKWYTFEENSVENASSSNVLMLGRHATTTPLLQQKSGSAYYIGCLLTSDAPIQYSLNEYNTQTFQSDIIISGAGLNLSDFPTSKNFQSYLVYLNSSDVVVGIVKTSSSDSLKYSISTGSTPNTFVLSVDETSMQMERYLTPSTASKVMIVFALGDTLSEDVTIPYTNLAVSNDPIFSGDDYVVDLTFAGQTETTVPLSRETSPYYDSLSLNKDTQLKLCAYRPRAYEAIYNCYVRDSRNNPYILNGQPEYNVWIPTDEGGPDTTTYELRNSNWEKDMFTTAVPSPQQGQAPLVGLTTYSTSDESGIMLNMALVDEDGKRYKLRFTSNDQELTGVEYSELSSDTPLQGLQFRNLVDAASTGISIPDFRIVNAYQRYLELNMRKGYSYRDIVEGRFDCKVRYDDLNMPEFLGGFTRKFTMNQVTQMVQRGDGSTYADALGSQAGDGYLSVSDAQPVSCFCDEESIVMCIISFTPVPVYTQVLDKSWLYSDILDHYSPEFANLGFQPIRYSELCPVESFNAGDDLNDVFGYNRAWYEFCQKLDKAHGLYRTQLRNFIVNRVFDSRPELSKEFLLCDAKQVNDIFQVTDVTDKFYGQITYACHAKLPIPKVSVPRLE